MGSFIPPCQKPAGIRPVQFVHAAGEQPGPGLSLQLSLYHCGQSHTVTLQVQPRAECEWSWRAGTWQCRDLPTCVSLSGSDLMWGQQSQPSIARAMHACGPASSLPSISPKISLLPPSQGLGALYEMATEGLAMACSCGKTENEPDSELRRGVHPTWMH